MTPVLPDNPFLAEILILNKYLIFILTGGVGAYIWFAFRRRFFDYIAAIAFATFISEGLKYIFNVPRPLIDPALNLAFEGGRFPSTHSTIAFTSAFFVLVVCHGLSLKKGRDVTKIAAGGLALLLATAVAYLRILIGAHYAVDLFAGIIIGLVISYLFRFYDVSVKKAK